MIEEACAQLARWRDAGNAGVRVAVNAAAQQLMQETVPLQVRSALAARKLDPAQLEVEITESLASADAAATGRVIAQLRELGVRVTLDDFGTGYSSTLLLAEYPFDTLKIDRSFVARIFAGPKERALTTAIISLAHAVGMTVVAEGSRRTSSSPCCTSSAPTRSRASSSRSRCPSRSASLSWPGAATLGTAACPRSARGWPRRSSAAGRAASRGRSRRPPRRAARSPANHSRADCARARRWRCSTCAPSRRRPSWRGACTSCAAPRRGPGRASGSSCSTPWCLQGSRRFPTGIGRCGRLRDLPPSRMIILTAWPPARAENGHRGLHNRRIRCGDRREEHHVGRDEFDPEEFRSKLLRDEHADGLRTGLAWLVRELTESEVAAQAGAALHEKSPERLRRRHGDRERLRQTRVGDLELAVPRLRSGSDFPSFLEPRSRSAQAFVAAPSCALTRRLGESRHGDLKHEALPLALTRLADL